MTDCALILDYLADGQWHNIIQMTKDLKPGCTNWAGRSRISDLILKKKFNIESRIGFNGCSDYRLILKTEPQPVYAVDPDGQYNFLQEA